MVPKLWLEAAQGGILDGLRNKVVNTVVHCLVAFLCLNHSEIQRVGILYYPETITNQTTYHNTNLQPEKAGRLHMAAEVKLAEHMRCVDYMSS